MGNENISKKELGMLLFDNVLKFDDLSESMLEKQISSVLKKHDEPKEKYQVVIDLLDEYKHTISNIISLAVLETLSQIFDIENDIEFNKITDISEIKSLKWNM